jgi:hypothetical protein
MNFDCITHIFPFLPLTNYSTLRCVSRTFNHAGSMATDMLSRTWLTYATSYETQCIRNKQYHKLPASTWMRLGGRRGCRRFLDWVNHDVRLPINLRNELRDAFLNWRSRPHLREWVERSVETLYRRQLLHHTVTPSLCLRQLDYLPRKITLWVGKHCMFRPPHLISHRGDLVALVNPTGGGWWITRHWTDEIARDVLYFERNPLQMLNHVGKCPFCGTDYNVPLSDTCAMHFAEFGQYIKDVERYKTENFVEKKRLSRLGIHRIKC